MRQPQATIGPFVGRWQFLSNFFPVEVVLDGVTFPSVEHAFQAAKSLSVEERSFIRDARSPGEAKRRARRVSIRDDWELVRDDVMLDLLRKKFAVPELRVLLLATGDRSIVELNDWADTYWGVCGGEGRNRLGELLEQVREELRRT